MMNSSIHPTAHPVRRAARIAAPLCTLGLALALVRLASAQGGTITVQVDRPGTPVPATLFGLFFEDISFAADGGLYPERIKNRSFEFPDPLLGWKTVRRGGADGSVRVLERSAGSAADRHFVRIETRAPGDGFGAENEGFRGMGVARDAAYTFTLRARREAGRTGGLRAVLRDADGTSLGETQLSGFTTDWKPYTATLRATGTANRAHLELLALGSGAVDLDDLSLYPQETWKHRKNGLRADLVRLLHDMKPGFVRFPGGCIVEGRTLETRYQWKRTIGPPEERKLIVNRWNTEFKHRPTPDYYQSFGLGFYEYFQLCEDIGAQPLPILNCGMACQFNSGELAPLDRLDPYVQDALDLIEFANGPATSRWGARRAAMGHPAPFHLRMIGVGNEQWGPDYIPRYEAFARAIKSRHPAISLVSSAGPSPSGERFDFAWSKLRELGADIVDEHYYMAPRWFRENARRYDSYPRTGPKVFAGEYAAQSAGIARPDNRNNWECALSEAAFMTGLERNCDVVRMSSYAPLFAHVDAWQWTPDLIWYDNLRSYGTPNYYVQQLFSANRGTALLPVAVDGSTKNGEKELFTTASLDGRAGEVVLKLVNTTPAERPVRIRLAGAKRLRPTGRAYVLASADLKAENSLDQPRKVAPVEKPFPVPGGVVSYTLAPNSLTVLRIGVGRP